MKIPFKIIFAMWLSIQNRAARMDGANARLSCFLS